MPGFATSVVRAWTAIYTRGLPQGVRAERREEIDSDVWEQRRKTESGLWTALHMLLRLALGAPADLIWRAEVGEALRSGKDLDMKNKNWGLRRVLALFFAVAVLPVPISWLKPEVGHGTRGESTLSALALGIGGQLCLMPVLLGVMTIAWDLPALPVRGIAEGSAEIAAGGAALAGLYIARKTPVAGIALITCATVAMALLASWAFPAVAIVGVALAAMAIVRWQAPDSDTRVLAA